MHLCRGLDHSSRKCSDDLLEGCPPGRGREAPMIRSNHDSPRVWLSSTTISSSRKSHSSSGVEVALAKSPRRPK